MTSEDPKALKDGLLLFEKDFQLDTSYLQLEEQADYTYEQAYAKVFRVVSSLLDTDFQRLVSILYRIDVSEQRLKEALAAGAEAPSEVITKMIIERELQKVATRKKYR